jgi:hypothetical protein
MTVVWSAANNIGADKEFILKRRSFIFILWTIEALESNMPQSEIKFWVELGDFMSPLCLLLVKYDLNQSSDTPWVP